MPERAGEQSIWTIHSFSTASMLMQTKRIQKGGKGNSMRGKEKEIGLAPAAWSIVLATCEVYNFKLPASREVTAGRGVTFHDRPYISEKDIIVPCTCGAQPLKIKATEFISILFTRTGTHSWVSPGRQRQFGILGPHTAQIAATAHHHEYPWQR